MTLRIDVFHHLVPGDGLSHSIESIRSLIVTTAAELGTQITDLTTQIGAVSTQLGKAKDEVVAKVADLEARINAGADIPPDVIGAFNALKTSVNNLAVSSQALDDLNPDAPTP